MKRITIVLLIILVLLSSLCTLACHCDGFDKKLKKEVLEDYLVWSGIQSDKSPNEIEFEYFGVYGNSVAIYFHTAGAYETPIKEDVVGYTFTYPDSRVIRIWNNGKFYVISEAYEMGLISSNHIFLIWIQSLFLKFQEPYFIYEEKIFHEYSLDDMFLGKRVTVGIDKGIGRKNKEFTKEFFAGVDFDEDVEYIIDTSTTYYDTPNWRQTISLMFFEPSKDKALEYVEILRKIDGVVWATVDVYFEFNEEPNDPLYYSGGFIANSRRAPLDTIQAPRVWNFTTGSKSVKVGIMDSGIGLHEDLNDNYFMAYDFTIMDGNGVPTTNRTDYVYHGTHVAGIVGALGNNGIGVTGVNWNVSLIQYKIGDDVIEELDIKNAF